VPLFWVILNLGVLLFLSLLVFWGYDLAGWVYAVMGVALLGLLYQERWVYDKPSHKLLYERGLRGWSRRKIFSQEDLQGLVVHRVGRYSILCLKAQGREWEVERSLSKTSLESLRHTLIQDWDIKK
jgi:hypothetical protein